MADVNMSHSQSSSLDEDELGEMVNEAQPDTTKRATKWGVRKFEDWLQKRGKVCDYHTVTSAELGELLRKFYAEVKAKKQGIPLTPSTLTCIRAALHRHITGAPFNRNINIIGGDAFVAANKMYATRCQLYQKAGHKKTQQNHPLGRAT